MLYTKLAQLRGKFIWVLVHQGVGNISLSGKLVECTPEFCTVQLYDKEGYPEFQRTIPTPLILACCTGHRAESELQAIVSWAATEDVILDRLAETVCRDGRLLG